MPPGRGAPSPKQLRVPPLPALPLVKRDNRSLEDGHRLLVEIVAIAGGAHQLVRERIGLRSATVRSGTRRGELRL